MANLPAIAEKVINAFVARRKWLESMDDFSGVVRTFDRSRRWRGNSAGQTIGGFSGKNTAERVAPIVDRQSSMKSRFAVFLSVIAVFQLMGGHWPVLQATAWVGMLVKYSEAAGVEVGISKTFDGKHPCDLCLGIANYKQTEKKQTSQLDAAKIYLVAPAQRWRLQPPRYCWRLRTTIASLIGCDRGPPVPPPRAS